MRTIRRTKAAACAATALALAPITADALPTTVSKARAPASQTASAAQQVGISPAAGSTNVTVEGNRIILGSQPATAGSSRISQRSGIANLDQVRLAAATRAVVVNYTAGTPDKSTAEVDVRALVRGQWTEWTPARTGASTALAASSNVVQLRIILIAPPRGGRPWVSDVSVRPSTTVTAGTAAILAAPRTYRVYATREGLVGRTTANGSVIVSRDHFVALPSRRSLASRGSGSYSVKVCVNRRCAFEPVWDVGPWNTRDDYWNPSAIRQMWKNLPQGRPEAYAAYQLGYNGGRDQYGRKVLNPAGIDLADGVFWNALRLPNNSWVDVTYMWTGGGGRGTVAISSSYLNVRNAPRSTAAVVGMAGRTAQVTVQCQTIGQTIRGSQGTTRVWLRVHAGMYVSKAYVRTGIHRAC
jgi:hypothetical protein